MGVDAGAQNYFLPALNGGQVSRSQVAQIVLASQEYRTDLVQTYYLGFLHRTGDANGLTYFTNQLNSGVTDESVLAQILNTDEFFRRGI